MTVGTTPYVCCTDDTTARHDDGGFNNAYESKTVYNTVCRLQVLYRPGHNSTAVHAIPSGDENFFAGFKPTTLECQLQKRTDRFWPEVPSWFSKDTTTLSNQHMMADYNYFV